MNANDVYLSIRNKIFTALDAEAVNNLSKEQLYLQLANAVDSIVKQDRMSIPSVIRQEYAQNLTNELAGLGPLQSLMDDDSIADIMINGPQDIYIERGGLIEKSPITFIDEQQLQGVAKRIATEVGRRVDSSSPTCDARLVDGSRVNIVLPPIAIDGTSISIRKFQKSRIDFKKLCEFGAMSPEMAQVLMIAARCRLNVIISGGTGSGKTTMLNALSQFISEKERIVTIEDAAELQLQQPHVVRLETRSASIENTGAITQRDLVINSLRMRPDRIIMGECRGSEAFEMLQAMNTGHDGSMSTLHANTPRDAIARIESMVMMATSNLPLEAIRRTIVSAVDIIVQVSRLHDGSRKVMSICEVVGLEGQSTVLEEIFKFQSDLSHSPEGKVKGEFTTAGLIQRSALIEKAQFFGLQDKLLAAFSHVNTSTDM